MLRDATRLERPATGGASTAGTVPAVVVNVGWVPGVSTIQALGRAGIPVHAVDHRPSALGFRSRYAVPHLCPSALQDERGFIDGLARLAAQLPGPAPIFPVDDEDMAALARHRDAFEGRLLFPFPGWQELERILDKEHQTRVAAEVGVRVPRVVDHPDEVDWFPALVKPLRSGPFKRRLGVKAVLCETRSELADAWTRSEGFERRIWEWIPGGDGELPSLGAYLSPQGEALGVFAGRKLLQDPVGIGTARVAEVLWADDVVDQGLALLRGLGFHGVAQVEFKRDPRTGELVLIEVNPRLWQWHSLAAACGVNLPAIAYRDALGIPQRPVTSQGKQGRWAITLKGGKRPAAARPPFVDPLLGLDDRAVVRAHLSFVAHATVSALRGWRPSRATAGDGA